MRRPRWIRPVRLPEAERKTIPGSSRDRLAVMMALMTAIGIGLAFSLSKSTQFLMPGPLASAHGAIKTCNTCHTKSGSGKLSWVHGLVPGDPLADSKACLTCHKMPETAFNAHSAPAEALKSSTRRLTKIAAETPQPRSARAQNFAFPADDLAASGLNCAACHQEHQGVNFNLNKISNEQCRSCHAVKFDSFDGNHPKFDNYPFERRTRIVYDHAGHFNKHYPELAKKDPEKRIPATCSTCHDSNDGKRIMSVAPFEKACAGCHLGQITGKERASGPKGIAFLTLPGIDVQSLKKKNAAIGEWPDASDAALTPFMKVMISRNERGRALIKAVHSLNLQDLSDASEGEIKAVTDLVWEIKGLFHALISGKASDVLGDITIGSGAKLSATLVADLTASIPRDVVASAQQEWLPNLATEMAKGATASEQQKSGWSAVTTDPSTAGPAPPEEPSAPDSQKDASEPIAPIAENESAPKVKLDPPACVVRLLGQCLVSNEQKVVAKDAKGEGAAAKADAARAASDDGKETRSVNERPSQMPGAMRAGLADAGPAAAPGRASGKAAERVNPDGGKAMIVAEAQPPAKASDQSDDLLFPTEDELREIKARNPDAGKAAQPAEARASSAADPEAAPLNTQSRPAPVISIESGVDPESWAEYGGWYRQDFEIFYRPTGHKDKFIYSWLFLTGPQTPKSQAPKDQAPKDHATKDHATRNDASPAAAVFDFLTSKDAQGSCTKCHSIDDLESNGRAVNFSPLSVAKKQGRFTRFIHEPHFGIMDDRGCLTCHTLEKGQLYLKSYEQGNPQSFVSNFGAVKKDLCQTCHTSGMARQDCLTCHKYHVNDPVTPITTTKNPTQ